MSQRVSSVLDQTEMASTILNALFSRKSAAALLGTASYVTYTDFERYKRMCHVYDTGNMTYPLRVDVTANQIHFERPALEKEVRKILAPNFSGQFYLIRGDVGTGKSYLVQKVVRSLINRKEGEGKKNEGAPIYLDCVQGKNFADTLAEAVQFYFDEHINFRYLILLLFGIAKMPLRDESHKLLRVLDAIERSSYAYAQKKKRPSVLVVDNIDHLTRHHKHILEKLLEKAKLWADSNICKVVFVCSHENTENVLIDSPGIWMRLATPLVVVDLTENETTEYVKSSLEGSDVMEGIPSGEHLAREIYGCVGGRIIHLQTFTRMLRLGESFEEIKKQLIVKELEKFAQFSKSSGQWKFLEFLFNQSERRCLHSTAMTSFDDLVISDCSKRGLIDINRHSGVLEITFSSKLTETTFESMLGIDSAKIGN